MPQRASSPAGASTRGNAVAPQRYYNYILVSKSTQRTYNGITNDLDRRLRQHRGQAPGGAKSTRTANDWTYLAVIHHPGWAAPASRRRGGNGEDDGQGAGARDGAGGGGGGAGGKVGKVGKAAAAAFEVRLRYPTGSRPKPSRFSGPAGRLASLELLLPAPPAPQADGTGSASSCSQTSASPAASAAGPPSCPGNAAMKAARSAAARAASPAEAEPGPGAKKAVKGAGKAAEPAVAWRPGLWVWVHPRYRHLAGPALRSAMVAPAEEPSEAPRSAASDAPSPQQELEQQSPAHEPLESHAAAMAAAAARLEGLSREERCVLAFLESPTVDFDGEGEA